MQPMRDPSPPLNHTNNRSITVMSNSSHCRNSLLLLNITTTNNNITNNNFPEVKRNSIKQSKRLQSKLNVKRQKKVISPTPKPQLTTEIKTSVSPSYISKNQ